MKQKLFLFILLSVSIPFGLKSEALVNENSPEAGAGIVPFYSSLSPYGEWIEAESGFYIWKPFDIPDSWRPYLLGRWIWTDYGWYWVSSEPFGWITYHYGRWYYDNYYGWVWVPNDVWGPAWVEWRYDDDYIGWAPLPPYAIFNTVIGIRFTTLWAAPVRYWNFIHYHQFGTTIRYRDVAPERYARRLIHTSRSSILYEFDQDRIINRGVDRTIIEQRGGFHISRIDVQDVRGRSGERFVRFEGNNRSERIEIYRPSRDVIQHSTEHIETRRGDHAISIDLSKIDRSQQIRSRTLLGNPPRRDEIKTEEPQSDRTFQREERKHDSKPRLLEWEQKRERSQMRRELIQRNERQHNPLPPSFRETSKQKIKHQLENFHHDKTTDEGRSERGGERRRGK